MLEPLGYTPNCGKNASLDVTRMDADSREALGAVFGLQEIGEAHECEF